LRKLLDYDFDVLLLCDGQPVLSSGKIESRRVLEHSEWIEARTGENFRTGSVRNSNRLRQLTVGCGWTDGYLCNDVGFSSSITNVEASVALLRNSSSPAKVFLMRVWHPGQHLEGI
jgi:hypothetical protein